MKQHQKQKYRRCIANIITTLFAAIIMAGCQKNDNHGKTKAAAEEPAVLAEDILAEEAAGAKYQDTTVFLLDSILRGEGPFNVMERLNIDRKIRQRLLFALANEADLTTLRLGEKFAAIYNMDTTQILEFIYYQDKLTTHRIKISFDEEDGSAKAAYVLEERPHETRHRLIKGTLNLPTLDAELKDMEISPLVAQITANVLECKIAFRTDARIGDEFEILVEETIYMDTADGTVSERVLSNRNDVLFVSYSGERAGLHKAYKYFDGDKSSHNAHYTESGEALIFAGLRYPLDRIHITSSYGSRIHPVTGQRQMHNGVDYRASTGARVYAVAEGRVTKSAFDNNSGHYIAIKHSDNTSSYYLHLSRRSVNAGANVKARQVIGLSGNSGMSSGPHLHFGVRQANGTWMNPLSKKMIATPKLDEERMEKLKEQIEDIKDIYNRLNQNLI